MKSFLLIIFLLMFFSCHHEMKPDKWSEQVIADLTKEPVYDRTDTIRNDTDNTMTINYYKNEVILKSTYSYYGENPWEERIYSSDRKVELRRERCANSKLGFEGILYDVSFYGLCTWYDCHGGISLQGIKYRNEKIGIWNAWEDGRLTGSEDYGKENYVDSLPYSDYVR